VHKERNLHSYLPRRHHVELSRLLQRLRRAQGADAAKEAYRDVLRFLQKHNAAAAESLARILHEHSEPAPQCARRA